MFTSALLLACVSLLLSPAQSCYLCFVDVKESLRLCWGYLLTELNVRSVDTCFKRLDYIFNKNTTVIKAGRVGKGYDVKLKEILNAEILPLVEEFDKKLNADTVYEQRLQTAADNFILAASKLPRVSGCFPPCGFQSAGAAYNCITCQYDSCEFPLDCPVTPQLVVGHTELQEIFDLSLLPGGQLFPASGDTPYSFLASLSLLLGACLTALLLLLFLSLGVLGWSSIQEQSHTEEIDKDEDLDLF